VSAKEELHRVIDDLSESEAKDALVYLTRRHDSGGALLELLAGAPEDRERSSPEEENSVREA
jgi:hypothetical protein